MLGSTYNRLSKRALHKNKTSWWLIILLIVILVLATIYALPNLFGEYKALQISNVRPGVAITDSDVIKVKKALNKIHFHGITKGDKHLLVTFDSVNNQLLAKERLKKVLSNDFIVATFNAPATPGWLLWLNARPMKLGLDLQGGMSLLLQVDIDGIIHQYQQNQVRHIGQTLRQNKISYTSIIPTVNHLIIHFNDRKTMDQAMVVLTTKLFQYHWAKGSKQYGQTSLIGMLSPLALANVRKYTMEQTLTTLGRRVNELGISEATVQQQGVDRVLVSLPGVSDATQAQNILGKTATIQTYLVDMENDPVKAQKTAKIPSGDILLYDQQKRPILLKNRIILSGENITSASSSFDQNGNPQVLVRVASAAQKKLYDVTSQNHNRLMSVVYTDVRSEPHKVNGETKIFYKKTRTVINTATIMSTFSTSFSITGLASADSAKQLALLLRAGSLPAPITILSERQVGPSMGKQNVKNGRLSVEIGFILVVVFMAVYYRMMGIIADIALFINLILILAIMSLLGGVLTFPGIAGLVLTIGMAVDGNVLILERIREELRRGVAIQAAIQSGYERACATIVDAQLTTLIAGMVLFTIGSGAIKGFAIILTIGLFTSMLTSITYTRAMVNVLYGNKRLKKLPIGIKIN